MLLGQTKPGLSRPTLSHNTHSNGLGGEPHKWGMKAAALFPTPAPDIQRQTT